MSVLGHVFDNLKAMSLLQLLLAFLACIGYAVAQGGLLGARGRQWSGLMALVAAIAFTMLASDWMAATMLMAFAVAGMGVFVALAWVLSQWVSGAGRPAASDLEFGSTVIEIDLALPVDSAVAPSRAPLGQTQSA